MKAARYMLVGTLCGIAAGCAQASQPDTSPATSTTNAPITGTFPLPINQPTTTALPRPSVTDSATGAIAISLSPSDVGEIVNAYQSWSNFPGNCTVEPVKGTLKAARVTSTGVTWAFGEFHPPPGCTVSLSTGTVDIVSSRVFTDSRPLDSGVFEKQEAGSWRMNYYEGVPFPCPDNPSVQFHTPGEGNPYVPLSVLNAVGVSYAASGCDNMFWPPTPR